MRPLIFLILTLSSLHLGAQNKARKYRVRLSRTTLTVQQTFSEIEAQTRLTFSYGNDLPTDQRVSFDKTQGEVSEFLETISQATGFACRVKGKKVLVYRSAETDPSRTEQSNRKHTISGYLRDSTNGENLLYGRITAQRLGPTDPNRVSGALSNEYGFYSLTLPAGEYRLTFQYLGFQPYVVQINLQQDRRIDPELRPEAVEIEVVEINDDPQSTRLAGTEVGLLDVNIAELDDIPVVLGERDVLKSIALLPGISGASEGSGNLYVRGGTSDQNLLLLDEAPVYNPSHLLGFFSIFNSDALQDVKVFKGGVPAQYGGRSSSVFDIRMKEGNRKKFSGSGGIGLIASRLALEGPIGKGRGSFLLSGRRTYLDLLTRFSTNPGLSGARLFFYDLNGKINYQFGDRDRLYVSFYNGRDVVATTEAPIGLDWGNATLTLRWNHLFSDRVFSNTSLIFSDYNYLFKLTAQNLDFTLSSGISNANFKQDFTFFLNEGNTIRTGLNTIAHSFKSGEFSVEGQGLDDVFTVGAKQALETGIYVGNDQQVSSRLRLNYGWRFSIFNLVGPATVYEFTPAGDPRDTLNYDALATYRTYAGLAPRFSAAWRVSETQSIKFAYARLFQYIHKLSNSSASLPTDYWVPTSEIVRPQRTDQFSLSYFHDLLGGKLQASAETFYKSMANQIDYRDGAALFFNDQFESQLVFGRGRTYGVEMLLRKPGGRWHGWLSYTILRSLRQFDDINGGAWYSARQDRIHDVAIVLGYDLNDHLELNLNWVFATGDAVTFPSGKYEIDGNTVTYYTGRNEYRFPPNHRLDLGLTWYPRTNEKFDHDLNFSVYNVYARQNPFLYQFRDNENAPGQLEVVRVALFSVVPSIAWNFRF